jgi:predicted O-linked N-acetylglucosamine transferase (SPINDLY family)
MTIRTQGKPSGDQLFQSAIASLSAGRFAEAEGSLKEVLELQPGHLGALNILTIVLMQGERFAEAEKFIRTALSLDRTTEESFYNYGIILKRLGRPNEALEQFDLALSLNPRSGETWNNRGTALSDLHRHQAAVADFDKAISLDPRSAATYCNKGKSLGALERHAEALSEFDRALAINPNLIEAWIGRAIALRKLNRPAEVIAAYDKALGINPHFPGTAGARLLSKMQLCDWSNFDAECAALVASVKANNPTTEPFVLLALPSSSADQLHCAIMWVAKNFRSADGPTVPRKDRPRNKRIRLGYVSADFHEHATSYLMAGLFECHDRSRFEVTGISLGPDDRSATRLRVKSAFEHFIDASGSGDDAVASQIAEREIDVLVDLKGFTEGGRPAIFAQRPAAIQVNYLGFPGTMGARWIDYLVADRTVLPDASKKLYAEKIVYLPGSYQVNDRKRVISERVFSRSELGLPPAGFVFCCFNNNYKIVPSVFDCWMRILRRVEGSVLWLLENNKATTGNLIKEASARGVNPERLVFAQIMPLADHLARLRSADLFLDTLPYNAHTTASDALWAGVPVLTCIGETFAGRVAASLLNAVGLSELIASSRDDYERSAVELATDRQRFSAIKAKLQANRLAAPLFDTERFTRHIETAYAQMYERHRAGLAPDHFVVSG